MTTIIDYALMAGHAYRTTRDEVNWIPAPKGWTPFFPVPDPQTAKAFPAFSGFEAVSFQNTSNPNEIVISYAGTNPADIRGDIAADLALALGAISDQIRQAADYYLAVKASVPEGTKITFTGHSLGGGLASLMAVFFGESGYTFDQAPFLRSALTTTTDIGGNIVTRSVAADLKTYLVGKGATTEQLAKLSAYIAAADPSNTVPIAADTLTGRQQAVTNINTEGEFLTSWPGIPTSNRIGSQANIVNSHDGVGGIALHSQALLTAFLQSDPNAATNTDDQAKTLNRVTFKLLDLLKMIFDETLFANDPNNKVKPELNFLERLVKHQAGNGTALPADAMVTRFTADLWKLAQEGGLTMIDGNPDDATAHLVSNALIAFAMQKYYEEEEISAGYKKEFFNSKSGAVDFDMADLSLDFEEKFKNNEVIDLRLVKGFGKYLIEYIKSNNFNNQERQMIYSLLPSLRDWYVQAGANAMQVTDEMDRGAFMLGGARADSLAGGSGSDLLVGNAGSDTLNGGKGNDLLLGGLGNDVYKYYKGDGFDTIYDKDGSGQILIDDISVSGGNQYGDTRVYRDTERRLYVKVSENNLIIDGKVLVLNFDWKGSTSALGIKMEGPKPNIQPQISTTIFGDLKPEDIDLEEEGVQVVVNELFNPSLGTSEDYEDLLFGSFENDHILGGALTDELAGGNGDDWLEGGNGNDWIRGESRENPEARGSDLIEGGEGSDILRGDGGNDRIYGNIQVDTETAIALGNGQAGTGKKGDWLAGNVGDDLLISGGDNDVITGGAGDDLIVGGAGDDNLLGDADYFPQGFRESDWRYETNDNQYWFVDRDVFNWTFYDEGDLRIFFPVVGEKNPADSGNDVIYAGNGNDYVWGGAGDDVLFGEGDNDLLNGNEGNDVVIGGDGNDTVSGAEDDDYLDGGKGDDVLSGGNGNDVLIGGLKNDELHGGDGQDVYIFNPGDGIDTIYDNSSDLNTIRFGIGFVPDQIKLRLGSLLIDMGSDAIHIGGFDRSDVFNSSVIKSFEFSDGSSLTISELLARGFDLDGTDGREGIFGTNTNDRIYGKAGADHLEGGAGDDINPAN